MPESKSLDDAAKAGLESLEAFLANTKELPGAQALLEAARTSEPDVRRHLAELAAQEPVVADEGQLQEAHAAAIIGTPEALARACERGADWNAAYYPWQGALSALEIAIDLDELGFAKSLLEMGVSTDSPAASERRPKTALSSAIAKRKYDAVRLLLAHGVKVTQSADLPGLDFDVDVLDELIAAGLDVNEVAPGALAGAASWAAWHRSTEDRLAWFRVMVARGYKIGLAQLYEAMDQADHNAETAETLCEGLLELGGDALIAELPEADQLMELAWESLTAKTLARLAELGAPLKVKRIKRDWTDAQAKTNWLEERKQVPSGLPSLLELVGLADDLLAPQVVADVLIGTRKGMELGGIALGDDAAAVAALGLDLEQGSYDSEADLSTKDAASNSLELHAEDGHVSGLRYQLRLPVDPRADAAFVALEARLSDRFGKQGKGRKGKKRAWVLDGNTLELARTKDGDCYPLEITISVEIHS